jgi:RimJ/RimL family protein N-acetyltransferase
MMNFRIESERMYIREWRDGDLPAFRSLATDPRVMEYVNAGKPWTEEQIRFLVQREKAHLARLGYCLGPLIRKSDDRMIGISGLKPLGTTPHIEIGWWLDPEVWKQGMGSEISRSIVQYGFGPAALQEVVAIVHPENQGSIRIIEKLGMQYERLATGAELGLRLTDVIVRFYRLRK